MYSDHRLQSSTNLSSPSCILLPSRHQHLLAIVVASKLSSRAVGQLDSFILGDDGHIPWEALSHDVYSHSKNVHALGTFPPISP